jgi:hypothetical protein
MWQDDYDEVAVACGNASPLYEKKTAESFS